MRQGRGSEARRWLERAIALAEATGDVRAEGMALGTLAELVAAGGDTAGALRALERGEARLRAAGDPIELAK
ncbi:MAG: hypothetical protein ACK559_25450, partial [bacterium]